MKQFKYRLLFITAALSAFCTTAAAQEGIPGTGPARIPWAIKCCGAMPKGMRAGFILLAAAILITIVYAKKHKGDQEK